MVRRRACCSLLGSALLLCLVSQGLAQTGMVGRRARQLRFAEGEAAAAAADAAPEGGGRTEETKVESEVAELASQEAEAAEAHKSMEAWLEHYFATEGDSHASVGSNWSVPADTSRRAVQKQMIRKADSRRRDGLGGFLLRARREEAGAAASVNVDGACVLDGEKRVPRDNLVIAPVGDHFDRRIWLNAPDAASFDLILIHYGDGPGQYCPECKEVYQAKGPKWRLVHELFKSPDWEGLRQHYRAVMLADADLLLDTCTINRAFEVFHEYNLLMAQPSLCDKSWVYSYWRILFQQPQNILRFVTFNEIMAPIFRMDMFNGLIGPSLYNAYTGWGLDMLWPFKLRYPKNQIAVIDEVCMHHFGRAEAGDNVYDSDMPYDKYTEWGMRREEYNLTEEAVKEMGFPFQPVEELGVVPKRRTEDCRCAGEAFAPGDDNVLFRGSSLLMRVLGMAYPVLVGLQLCITVAACAFLARLRRRQCAL